MESWFNKFPHLCAACGSILQIALDVHCLNTGSTDSDVLETDKVECLKYALNNWCTYNYESKNSSEFDACVKQLIGIVLNEYDLRRYYQ